MEIAVWILVVLTIIRLLLQWYQVTMQHEMYQHLQELVRLKRTE